MFLFGFTSNDGLASEKILTSLTPRKITDNTGVAIFAKKRQKFKINNARFTKDSLNIKTQRKLPVSIIIVNHNAGSLLSKCIQVVLQQAKQILVIDNASFDSSLSELESHFPKENQLQIVRLDNNVGFAAGCNTGLAASTQPYVFF